MFTVVEYLSAFFVVLLTSAVYFYYTKIYRLEKFFRNFPSPPTEPILGNARDFSTTSDFLKSLHRYTQKYGSMVHVRIGPIAHALVSCDYKFIQFVLNNSKSFHKSENLKFLEPWIGYGLVTIEGDVWKRHRRLLTPAFHFKILERFVDIFESATDILVEKLSQVKNQKSVDIHPHLSCCTLDVICETAMGTKLDAQNNINSTYLQSVKEMCRIFVVRSTNVLKRYDFLYSFTEDYRIQNKALKYLNDQTDHVLNVKKQKKKKNDNENDTKKKVFIDIILETSAGDNNVLSEREIRDEINTFMFGGHDTTAAASSFVLFCIANSKEVQDKLLKEQISILGDVKNPTVTYSNLQEMKYLEMVIKESMRLYSPVPLFGRQTCEDVEYNGMTIPKGTQIIIFPHGLHMNPEYYTNPEKFDPSRFETIDGKLPFAYLPFSAGPRNCIGQKYAMLEVKSLVAKIVRNFELSPASPHHEMDLAAETVLKSLNGVKVGLKKR